jgi:cell division protein FtsQ
MRWLSFGGARNAKGRAGRGRQDTGRGKKTRRAATRRRLPTWSAMVHGMRLTAGLLVLLAVTGAGVWVWQSGVVGRQIDAAGAALERVAVRGGLVVRSVTVEGRIRTEPARLLGALGTARGEPILSFDPHAARARVEALPWVAQARVERRLPDTIHVVLTERNPLALWQRSSEGDYALIDSTGTWLEVDTRPFADLPLIVGDDAPGVVPSLMDLLATEPGLAQRVRAATWVDRRRWTVRLDGIESGIDVRLPETNPGAAWRRLAALDRDTNLLARDIDRVDLRLPDRLVVRPRSPGLVGGDGETAPGAPASAPRVLVSTSGQET